MKRTLIFFLIIVFLLIIVEAFGIREHVQRRRDGVKPGVKIGAVSVEGLLEEEVYDIVRSIAAHKERNPQNAYFHRRTGEIVPEAKGLKINIQATVQKIMEAEPETKVDPVTIKLDAEIPSSFYKSFDNLVSSYSTWTGGGARTRNIALAAQAMNNYILAPGEVFSFNKAVGERTVEKGYEFAPIIVGGSVVPGIGGGICQVSSTLYNTVLKAELEVVERYPHSKPVYYVPPGRDATVSDHLDFKFRNSSAKYIMIKSAGGGGAVNVQLYSN